MAFVAAAALFTVAGGVVTIVSQQNVASITRSSSGVYSVTFTAALGNTTYSVIAGGQFPAGSSDQNPVCRATGSQSTSGFTLGTSVSLNFNSWTFSDVQSCSFFVMDPSAGNPGAILAGATWNASTTIVNSVGPVSSLTNANTGEWKPSFSPALSTANYVAIFGGNNGSNPPLYICNDNDNLNGYNTHATSSLSIGDCLGANGVEYAALMGFMAIDPAQYATGLLAAVRFSVSGTTCSILSQQNVASVTYQTTGCYEITFTIPQPTANYGVIGSCQTPSASGQIGGSVGINNNSSAGRNTYTTAAVCISIQDRNAGIRDAATVDVFVWDPAAFNGVAQTAPNLRTPLIVTQALAQGIPDLRTPLIEIQPVVAGVPDLRASLITVQPMAGGVPKLRTALLVVQAVLPVPEELPVATLIFPTLRGQSWPIKKTPTFNTGLRRVTSGRRLAWAYQQFPIWHFELNFQWLPDYNPGSTGYTDFLRLRAFFNAMQGQAGTFLFRDPSDYHVVGGSIATGDAVTLQWPFSRMEGQTGINLDQTGGLHAGMNEPVGQVDQTQFFTFPASAVNTGTSQINVNGHGLTTGQSPPLFFSNPGTLPTGLAASTPYWPIVIDANHFQLATTLPNALANINISLSAIGSGTNTVTKGFAVYETITEADTVPSVGPYTITVANASTFVSDGGVTIGGNPLTKVSSAPAANQYAVNTQTGVYTFNSAQASASASITYTWIANPAHCSLTLPNQLVFVAAPNSGAIITADFDFWFVCAFSEDKVDFEEIYNTIWDLEKLDFESVIQ